MYCRWRSSYQEGRAGVPLTGLTPPHVCACLKSGPRIPTSYVVVFFFVQWVQLRWEKTVDIGGGDAHYCLNCLFIFNRLHMMHVLVLTSLITRHSSHVRYIQQQVEGTILVTFYTWCMLLTFARHEHDLIISLRAKLWAYRTSLTKPLCIEVPVPSQESKLSFICLLVSIVFVADFTIFLIRF